MVNFVMMAKRKTAIDRQKAHNSIAIGIAVLCEWKSLFISINLVSKRETNIILMRDKKNRWFSQSNGDS